VEDKLRGLAAFDCSRLFHKLECKPALRLDSRRLFHQGGRIALYIAGGYGRGEYLEIGPGGLEHGIVVILAERREEHGYGCTVSGQVLGVRVREVLKVATDEDVVKQSAVGRLESGNGFAFRGVCYGIAQSALGGRVERLGINLK